MPQNCKEKICINCEKPFKPTSNVQKRCPACMAKPSRAKKHGAKDKRVVPTTTAAVDNAPFMFPANPFTFIESAMKATGADSMTVRRGNLVATFTIESKC